MSSRVEEFLKKVPGKRYDIVDIDSDIDQTGDLNKITGIDVIIKSLIRLFTIPKKSYLFDSSIGTSLYKYIFEPADIVTLSSIEKDIATSINRYENRPDVNITFEILFFKNKKGFRVDFQIDYNDQKKDFNISIDESLLKTLPK